jgi:DNA topoisomerase III
MDAILAEKPDQARKLASPFAHKKEKTRITIAPCPEFPRGAIIVWAIGHLCELAEPEKYDPAWKKWRLDTLPIIPDQFKHQVIKQKAGHFKLVKDVLNQADTIIIATDPAREGEYIARIIIQMAGASRKKIKRWWCSSLTEQAIKEAFGRLRSDSETKPYFEEALARSYSDWLVGINTSRVYTLLMQQKGIREVFSTGRVQTPLLCLIRRREEEIERFKQEPFWEIVAVFDADGEKYKGKLEERFFDKKQAERLLEQMRDKHGVVGKIETKLKKISPPLLHSLSTLQAKMNRMYKLAPSKVLQLVQSLYEKGYVSYPRTDSQHVTVAEAKAFPKILRLLTPHYNIADDLRDVSRNKRVVDPKKVSDHHAIIPTEQVPTLTKLTSDERKIYDELARSLIAVHYPDHEFLQTTVLTMIDKHAFKTVGKKVVKIGWKAVFQHEQEQGDEGNQPLPPLREGQVVKPEVALKEGMTQPPKPYTEGQLITLMKTAGKHIEDEELSLMKGLGLGTEATRSGIIQTLKDRKYIKVQKNVVSTTEKGKALVAAVADTILGKADLTAKWEQYLHAIGRGEKAAAPFIEKSKELAKHLVADAIKRADGWEVAAAIQEKTQTSGRKGSAQETVGSCPLCGQAVVDRKKFYGCQGYQTGCKFTLPKTLLGKKLSSAVVKKLLSGKESGLLKGFVSKKGKRFDARLRLENGSIAFTFPEGAAKREKT